MFKVFSVYCQIKPLCLVGKERDSSEALASGCVKIGGGDLYTKALCAGSLWLCKGVELFPEGRCMKRPS